jgi:hypothetical protein
MNGLKEDPRSQFEKFADLEISMHELRASTGSSWDLIRVGGDYTLTGMPIIYPSVEITAAHLRKALHAFVGGRVSHQELQDWANLVILGDDVFVISMGGSTVERDLLLELLHEIATPEIRGQLTYERSMEMIRDLPR